jgi:hypothetical protein
MLSASGEVKVLDLGLARLQYGESLGGEVSGAEITGTGQAMGTADYVAPEQVTDSKTVDIRADIYALGCSLFKLLTGRAPFADDQHTTAFAKMTAHVSKAPPSLATLLPGVPRGLANLLDSMLAKNPSDRPQTPGQVVDKLMPFCKGSDLVALSLRAAQLEPKLTASLPSASSCKPRTQSWMRRKVPTSVAIAAGLFGVVLGMMLSIIIVITNPDGTKSFLELAKGSKVEIKEGGSADPVSEHVGKVVIPNQTVAADLATPLSFGILVNPESTGRRSPWISNVALTEATRLLHASNGDSPVQTAHGTWLQVVPDDLPAPIKIQNAGKSFVLVSNEKMIQWAEIKGHVVGTQVSGREAALQMIFDEELGDKFRKLTGPNIRNQLAIIVNGEIRVAPYINSEIGKEVAITGAFKPDEVRQLEQLLFGGLVYPLRQAAPEEDGASNHEPRTATDEPISDASEPVTIAYQFSDLQVDAKLAVDVLSTLLAGKPGVRLAFDETSRKLIVLARSADHELIKKTLAELSSDGEEKLVPEQALNGVWRIQEVVDGGTIYPVSPLQQPAAVFHDGQMAIFRDNKMEEVGKFTIRSLAPNPENGIYPQIEIESSLNEKVMVGIFSFRYPNQLMICLNQGGTEVPTLFLSMENSPNDLLIKMHRVELPNDKVAKDAWLEDPTNATVAKAFEILDAWRQGRQVQ